MNSFIGELIVWIENNLDKKMGLDDVANRAGYSKWHLQRIFRRETGMTLATYIRNRRLSESAILLRMTSLPVIDTAEKFGFSSQQAFTRTFTQYFSHPPKKYRQSRSWSFRRLQPSLLCEHGEMPRPELVQLTMPPLESLTFSYQCPTESIRCALFHSEQYRQAWSKAKNLFHGRPITHIAEKYTPAASPQYVVITQTFSCSKNSATGCDPFPFSAPTDGLFLTFPFEGQVMQLMEMKARIYQSILPARAEVRRDEYDLLTLAEYQDPALDEPAFSGFYHIPVSLGETSSR
ncbi:helix-turn-helix domain-containing protein [Pantoea allii]|uniref:helix-turn-helix domain-containing protein n=1 Tax=Pantoea allii TaxID=574096 RepID=UPI003D31422F